MRVVTWNLFHGRAVPERREYLYDEFLALIGSWEWDVLLLQECPPWWPELLAGALGADHRRVLTSRNLGLALRRAIATRRPDLIKANGGGCNAILVRGREIVAHHSKRLRFVPERRFVHGVELDDGIWICNLHLQGGNGPIKRANQMVEARRAGAWAMRVAGEHAPIVLGGDFNISSPSAAGFHRIPGHRGIDQLFVRTLAFTGEVRALERGALSDHPPLRANIVVSAPNGAEIHA
ncbi:MAG TPA: endonuclease/exonuclease/phosphatase family protein [Baekduia sp.]|nr:endonuclease/exonuclease/phosphatase family protein [Baekduia sp.]